MDIDEAVNNTNTEGNDVDMVRAADSSSSYGSSSTSKSTLRRRVGILEADLLEVYERPVHRQRHPRAEPLMGTSSKTDSDMMV